jgi:hypothetical protein
LMPNALIFEWSVLLGIQQAVRHVQEAAHHWSRAAFALDTLLPSDLDASALARARQLSRIARTQQERLWQLTAEVCGEDPGGREGDPSCSQTVARGSEVSR